MAKYLTKFPAFIDGKYYGEGADVRNPTVIELPDDAVPSLKFEPMDQAAKVALKKLVDLKTEQAKAPKPDRDVPDLVARAKLELVEVDDKAAPVEDHTTMSEHQLKKPKRSSDKDAV